MPFYHRTPSRTPLSSMVQDIASAPQRFHAPNTLNRYPPQHPDPPCSQDFLLHFTWIKHEAHDTRMMIDAVLRAWTVLVINIGANIQWSRSVALWRCWRWCSNRSRSTCEREKQQPQHPHLREAEYVRNAAWLLGGADGRRARGEGE